MMNKMTIKWTRWVLLWFPVVLLSTHKQILNICHSVHQQGAHIPSGKSMHTLYSRICVLASPWHHPPLRHCQVHLLARCSLSHSAAKLGGWRLSLLIHHDQPVTTSFQTAERKHYTTHGLKALQSVYTTYTRFTKLLHSSTATQIQFLMMQGL